MRILINQAVWPIGTYYNVLFPLSNESTFEHSSSYDTYETADVIDAYEEIFKIKIHDIGALNTPSIFECDCKSRCIKKIRIKKDDITYASDKKEFFSLDKCKTCRFRAQMIIAIELYGDLIEADPSEIFRFLAILQYNESCQAIIIYNISKRSLKRLINILKIWEKITHRAWSKNQFVLFYYLPETIGYNQPQYFTWLIGGKRYLDSLRFNETILLTNKGEMLDSPITDSNTTSSDSNHNNVSYTNPLFSSNSHLLPFDVLLTNNEYSLFEWNAIAALNTSAHLGNGIGYKFENTHIKLGSKIHVDEFIYAKGLFQNSYYALRFGYQGRQIFRL